MRALAPALVVAGLAALVAAAGCGEARPRKVALEIKDVPPGVLKVARDRLPGVAFDAALKKEDGGYEVRGKARNGKVREIHVRPDGTVAEVE